jgi:hypothetical protein
MGEIESLIQGSEKLTSVFDGWPSFHDAEVVDLHIWRGEVKRGDWDDSNVFPVLTITVRILEATQPDATGDPDRDVLATFRFHDVDDLILQGFNHQNAILGITVSLLARGKFVTGEELPPYLIVKFEPAFGIATSFRCSRVEILNAARCGGNMEAAKPA